MAVSFVSGSRTTKRALFLCPVLDAGGAERHWASLLPALAERGLAVRLVAINGGGRALKTLRAAGVPGRTMGGSGMRSLSRLPRLLGEQRGQPDVVVTFGYNAHALGALFSRATGTPQLINWHRQQGWPMTRVEENSVRFAGQLGAGAIAVTRAQLPDLERLGIAETATDVVLNGVSAPSDIATSREELRATLDLPPDAFIAVLVARLRPEKRVADFIDALANLRLRVPGIVGVVVGDGPLDSELRQRASEREAPVRFAGFHPDPTTFMLAADVVCLTSEFEALPMALIEAISCGRPCIASDVGGAREIVADGENGFLFGSGDVETLAAKLEFLAEHDHIRGEMGARALARWRARFSFDAMVRGYFDLLTTVGGPPASW